MKFSLAAFQVNKKLISCMLKPLHLRWVPGYMGAMEEYDRKRGSMCGEVIERARDSSITCKLCVESPLCSCFCTEQLENF